MWPDCKKSIEGLRMNDKDAIVQEILDIVKNIILDYDMNNEVTGQQVLNDLFCEIIDLEIQLCS